MDDVIEFVLDNYPISWTWKPGILEGWLGWAASCNFLFVVRNDDETIAGVAIARPLSSVSDTTDTGYDFDADGQVIWVDLSIAPTKQILQTIAFGLLGRFGPKRFVAFRSRDRVRVHSLASARKALLRVSGRNLN